MRSYLTNAVLNRLRNFESPNITYLPQADSWPIIWERARGMKVWDIDGNEYLDLTAAFGVAAAGHAPMPVVRAGQRQMRRLLHAMGDVHPHALKAQLAERLSEMSFGRWQKNFICQDNSQSNLQNDSRNDFQNNLQNDSRKDSRKDSQSNLRNDFQNDSRRGKIVFCNSGFEAIEVALKTACQATGKPRIVCFEGAYHGLGYGSLVATHRTFFRGKFGKQIAKFETRLPFPNQNADLKTLRSKLSQVLENERVGAILVEPIQMRGGVNVPPKGFLKLLRDECNRAKCILIFDEIFTGFGRTGTWFACEHEGIAPDILCLGKALTGGFPLSAMIGRADLMDAAWSSSNGEAIHTSTYLGHPVGCAMALAQIDLLEKKGLIQKSAAMGEHFKSRFARQLCDVSNAVSLKGKGLLIGIELHSRSNRSNRSNRSKADQTMQIVKDLLEKGFIVLPAGEFGNVIGLTPPLIIRKSHIDQFVNCFSKIYKTKIA